MKRGMCLVVLAGFTGAEPAAGQGLGWLFGQPPPARHVARRRQPMPVDVPLPAPRPRFEDDAKPAGPSASPPLAAASNAPATSPPVAASPTAPQPPERPPQTSLTKDDAEPAGPSASPPLTAASNIPAASPPVAASPTAPLPPERPPQTDLTPPAQAPATKAAVDEAAKKSTASAISPKVDAGKTSDKPPVAASGATTAFTPRTPPADPSCADRLKARGVETEPVTLGPQPDARCTVVQPLRLVTATLADKGVVDFPDRPTIACTTADVFSAYVHDLLAPLAKGTWGVPVAAVWTGPGLECRSRDHIFGAKLSAHGQGLAIDIAQLKLADGRTIAVGEPVTAAERDFETAARAGGCGYFHTVLGPGSDAYHRTHWHFDLEVRGKDGDGKYCR